VRAVKETGPCHCQAERCGCGQGRPGFGPGRPVDQRTRQAAEWATGTPLRHVTVHDGVEADRVAAANQARAVAVDGRIALASRDRQPRSPATDAVLAHELAHLAQQRQGAGTPTGDEAALEADANRSAAVIVRSLRGEAPPGGAGPAGGHRPGPTPILRAPVGVQRFDGNEDPLEAVEQAGPSCPGYEAGEVAASRGGEMQVASVGGVGGMLVAGFAVGSGAIKPGLADHADVARFAAAVRADPSLRFQIVGYSDCSGDETVNTTLRTERADAVRSALPADIGSQITSVGPAPAGRYLASNDDRSGRLFNRSAFVEQQAAVVEFEDDEVAPLPPSHLYGVTSPASAYFVRTAPVSGEIIGKLALQEMHVKVIGESGANVEELWLEVEFTAADMATIQATYARDMAGRIGELPALQAERAELRAHIDQLRRRPGMAFEVQAPIARAEERLAPIESDIDRITAHQRRLVSPYTGTTGWVAASALGVTAIHYDTFLDQVDAFDARYASEPLRDRLTRLRQVGEDKSLQGDVVVGRGGDLPGIVTQSDRVNDPGQWEIFLEGKQVRMPDGSFLDMHHFVLGLDALALPASQMSSGREVSNYGVTVNVGESFSATTWSGDVGGAVGDFVHHKSGVWEQANPVSRSDRLDFYFRTRAPDMDLLADIDAWGRFGALPRTRSQTTTFRTLRDIIEAQYGPAGQTATQYEAAASTGRRDGIATFLCFYGFTGPTGLKTHPARARVEDEVLIFSRAWYQAKGGRWVQFWGPDSTADGELRIAAAEMTDRYLDWLERLAASQAVTSLTCSTE